MTANRTNLQYIILCRLLTQPKKGFSRKTLKTDLSSFVEHRWVGEKWSEEFDSVWTPLLQDGLVEEAKKVHLTDAGRQEICAFFGWEKIPGRLQWRTMKEKYLPAIFLGLDPGSEKFKKRFKGLATLRAECLRQIFDLKIDSMPTEVEAMNALLILAGVGMRNVSSSEFTMALLRNMVDEKDLPKIALQSGDKFQDKPAEPTPQTAPAEDPKPFDLEAFSRDVMDCARACPTGKWGMNKVYISHVWQNFQKTHPEWNLDETMFKKKLTEANHKHLLTLSHADLVGIMNPDDVKESETPYLNDYFHFVRIGRE